MTNDNLQVAVIGAGPISVEYCQILKEFNCSTQIIGRGEKSGNAFKEQTGVTPLLGGIENNKGQVSEASHIVIAVSEDQLGNVLADCLTLNSDAKILIEKPGALTFEQLEEIYNNHNTDNVYIAYNRRFFSSVRNLKEKLKEEGCTSFNFEFTEWGHVIEGLEKNPGVKENWFWHNSSHVIDLAFYLGGKPKSMSTFSKGDLSWHPRGSNFVGCGETDNGALFNYQANWDAPGRWGLEFLTPEHRYYLRPMEKLQVQNKGSVQVSPYEVDDKLDQDWKPGFYLQTKAFIQGDVEDLCSYKEQLNKNSLYRKMLSGEN